MPTKRDYSVGYSGDGFRIRRLGADKPLLISIRRWSRELERVLHDSGVSVLAVESGPSLRSFDFATGLRRLREFSLENTGVRARRYSIVPLARLPQLRKLQLHAGTKRGFGGIADIEQLGKAASLGWLSLDRGPGCVRPRSWSG